MEPFSYCLLIGILYSANLFSRAILTWLPVYRPTQTLLGDQPFHRNRSSFIIFIRLSENKIILFLQIHIPRKFIPSLPGDEQPSCTLRRHWRGGSEHWAKVVHPH